VLCRVLGVSTSGFYAWKNREPSRRDRENARLTNLIIEIHKDSRGTYGAPRVHAVLQHRGIRCSENRVARLMRLAGISGISRRKYSGPSRREGSQHGRKQSKSGRRPRTSLGPRSPMHITSIWLRFAKGGYYGVHGGRWRYFGQCPRRKL